MTRAVAGRAGAGAGRALLVLVVSAVLGALAWVVSLSYGFENNTYPTWQVVLAGVAVVAAVALSRIVAHHRALWATVFGVTVGFAALWITWAKADDPTGLWGVGALLLIIGLVVSCTVCGALVDVGLKHRRRAPR